MGKLQEWTDLDAKVLEQIRVEKAKLHPMTRQEIAARAGIPYPTYRRIEEGVTRPTANHLDLLTRKVYGSSLSEFYAEAVKRTVTAETIQRGPRRHSS